MIVPVPCGHAQSVTHLKDLRYRPCTAAGMVKAVSLQEANQAYHTYNPWRSQLPISLQDRTTALHVASRAGHVAAVEILLRNGANKEAATKVSKKIHVHRCCR